ncbi:hypothetical protein P3687_25030, partial [Vibrio parahaemolyticus]|nr:hypothetical protein [Vibrio parahaemolyticus]
ITSRSIISSILSLLFLSATPDDGDDGEAKRCRCANRGVVVSGATRGEGGGGGSGELGREDAGEVQAREEVLRQRMGM